MAPSRFRPMNCLVCHEPPESTWCPTCADEGAKRSTLDELTQLTVDKVVVF